MIQSQTSFEKMYASHVTNFSADHIADGPDKEALSRNQFVLVRHGVTDFNVGFSEVVKNHGIFSEEYRKFKVQHDLIDISLRPEGIQQCMAAQKHANEINFKYIFVSPMIRTQETAIHIFKNHPNKHRIKFIILPLIKEGLNTNNDKCKVITEMRKIIDPQLKEANMQFDYSNLYMFGLPDMFQVNVSVDIPRFQEMYDYIKREKDPILGYSPQLLQLTYDKFPYRMEDPLRMFQRSLQLRKFLQNFLKFHPLKDDEKIALVCHSAFMGAASAKGFNVEKNDLIDAIPAHNCELLPWSTFYLEGDTI